MIEMSSKERKYIGKLGRERIKKNFSQINTIRKYEKLYNGMPKNRRKLQKKNRQKLWKDLGKSGAL